MGIRRIYVASFEAPKADVVSSGSQIKFALPEIKKPTDQAGNKIGVIDMMDYGMMNGEKVLNMALELLEK
jgi:cellobiose-specific phosphotransferase enzyme IIB component